MYKLQVRFQYVHALCSFSICHLANTQRAQRERGRERGRETELLTRFVHLRRRLKHNMIAFIQICRTKPKTLSFFSGCCHFFFFIWFNSLFSSLAGCLCLRKQANRMTVKMSMHARMIFSSLFHNLHARHIYFDETESKAHDNDDLTMKTWQKWKKSVLYTEENCVGT